MSNIFKFALGLIVNPLVTIRSISTRTTSYKHLLMAIVLILVVQEILGVVFPTEPDTAPTWLIALSYIGIFILLPLLIAGHTYVQNALAFSRSKKSAYNQLFTINVILFLASQYFSPFSYLLDFTLPNNKSVSALFGLAILLWVGAINSIALSILHNLKLRSVLRIQISVYFVEFVLFLTLLAVVAYIPSL